MLSQDLEKSRKATRSVLRRSSVATQDWLLSHDMSSAVRRLAAALPAEDRPLWPIRFDFRPKTDCRQNCLWKRTFRNLNNVMYKIWFCGYPWLLLHKDFLISQTIMGEIIENFRRIGSELNGVATQFNRRIFSRHFKQPLLFMSFPQKFWLDLNILTRCIHTRYVCQFYFITNGCQNSMFCNIASIPRWNYEKPHRLKQRSLIGQLSLRTSVSQACPSGRIQG